MAAITARMAGRVAALAVFFAAHAAALDSEKNLSQYQHAAWHVQDGSIPGVVLQIVQSKDGYIWIGTNSGLVRFDGAKFSSFAAATGESLPSPRVEELLAERDGALLIGTDLGLIKWQSGHRTTLLDPHRAMFAVITDAAQVRDGSVWVVRLPIQTDHTGSLCNLRADSVRCFNENDGIETPLRGILEDKDGTFWLLHSQSISHWDPGTHQLLPGGQHNITDTFLNMWALTDDGSLLVSVLPSSRYGLASLLRLKDGIAEPFKAENFDSTKVRVAALFKDSHGSLWIMTHGDGLYRLTGARVEHYTTNEGLSDNSTSYAYEDREGNIWIGTGRGIDRFRDSAVTTYTTQEGLSYNLVAAVLARHDGSIWIENGLALDTLHPDGSVTSMLPGREIPGRRSGSLMEDRNNRLWMDIDGRLQILDSGGFIKPKNSESLPAARRILGITQDRDGDVWAVSYNSTRNTLLHYVDDGFAEAIPSEQFPVATSWAIAADPIEGIWVVLTDDRIARWSHGKADPVIALNRPANSGRITGLIARPDGLLIASSDAGLTLIRQGQVRQLTVAQGLPCNYLWTMIESDEALWLYSECGAIQLPFSEIERWWKDASVRPTMKVLDALDGIEAASAGMVPRAARTSDGRLWFANSTVLQMIDPRKSTQPAPPLKASIERVTAGGSTYSTSGQITLPALTKDVQVDYTSPSFAVPEKLNFQYKLEGLDNRWVDAGNRRQAFFGNLRPGTYRFLVRSALGGSAWSPESDLTFQVPPKFYQTAWFRMMCIAAAIGVLFLLFRLRIEAAKRELRARLQTRMDERERIARDLHDTLFQDIQGILLAVDNSTNKLPDENFAKTELKNALQLSDRVMTESRNRVLDLRAGLPDTLKIGAALGRVCEELAKAYPCQFRVIEVGNSEALQVTVFEECFHVAREALFNAFRHSGAKQVEIEILFGPDRFSLMVRDDGKGIDESVLMERGKTGHFGLRGMHERAEKIGAKLSIRSASQAGTEIELSMPRTLASGSRGRRPPRYWIWGRMRSRSNSR